MRNRFIIALAVLACGMSVPGMASAGSIGTYCWQLVNANSDIVCLNLNDNASQAGIFTGAGTQSTTTYRYPIVGGVSFDEHSGVYQVFWTTYVTALAAGGEVSFGATINPGDGSGTWYCGGIGCPKLYGNSSSLGPMLFLGLVSSTNAAMRAP
jgi:hypothetical protein